MFTTSQATVPGLCLSYSYLPLILTLQSRGGCFHRNKPWTVSLSVTRDIIKLCQLEVIIKHLKGPRRELGLPQAQR